MAIATQEAVVHAMTMASPRAVLIELRPAPGEALPPFAAGAHIDVRLEGLVRQYSLLGSPRDRDRYLICIQDEPGGRGGSTRLLRELRVGGTVSISEPRNTFALDPAGGSAVLVGAGIGLTPLLAMAEELVHAELPFELHCYARSASELPLREHIASRPYAAHAAFHFSEEGDSARVSDPACLAAPTVTGRVYVCGPTGFIDHILDRGGAAGWLDEQLRIERFQSQIPKIAADDGTFVVCARSTGEDYEIPADKTIAEVLTAAGVPIVLSCEQGICGACLTPVLAGTPDHRDEIQTDAEHAANTHVTICCSRSLTERLELDL
jgi:vanillate O-demethylase ferredoxin subunit